MFPLLGVPCIPPPHIASHNNISLAYGYYLHEITISCDDGYIFNDGQYHQQSICNASGLWTNISECFGK